MQSITTLCCWLLVASLASVRAANILAVFPSDYKSHLTLGSALFTALADRGHNITVITQHKLTAQQRHPHISEIQLTGVAEHLLTVGQRQQTDALRRDQSVIDEIVGLIYGTAALADYTLAHPDVQRIIRRDGAEDGSRPVYDLLLIDAYFNDALLGLAQRIGAEDGGDVPTVVLSATATSKWTNEMVGTPHNPAYNPSTFLGYSDRMGVRERFWNALAAAFEKITYNYMYLPAQQTIYERYFGASPSPLIDRIHNVSLVLINSHPALQYPRPLAPNMLQIGGMHLTSSAQPNRTAPHLADAVAEWLAAAPEGCIYVSLGTARRSADLPAPQIDALRRVFASLAGRMRIVWKWENATLTDQPPNVLIGEWLPQQAILAHPNVRLFITNGGASSLLEAADAARPIVGIPMHGDQFHNVGQAVRAGLGIQLDAGNLTEATVAEAVERMLNGEEAERFRSTALRLQALLRDSAEAVAPLAAAVHGVELVVRTGGARHLRSPAVDLSLWQQSLCDVALAIVLIVAAILAVPSVVICLVLRRSHARAVRQNGVGLAVNGVQTVSSSKLKKLLAGEPVRQRRMSHKSKAH